MLALLKDFWVAVRNTFPSAWGQPPRRSRLMHGVGIASMGFLMDAIADRYAHLRVPSVEDFEYDLYEIADSATGLRAPGDSIPSISAMERSAEHSPRHPTADQLSAR